MPTCQCVLPPDVCLGCLLRKMVDGGGGSSSGDGYGSRGDGHGSSGEGNGSSGDCFSSNGG
jgi:hypothetical protein